MKNLKCFIAIVCNFILAWNSYAIEQAKFITMPDDINSALLKSIYESQPFSINKGRFGYCSEKEVVQGESDLRNIWLGSPINNKQAKANKIKLFFTPKKVRKVGDTYLEDFNIEFNYPKVGLLTVALDNLNKKDYYINRTLEKFWIQSKNRPDMFIFLPEQPITFKTLGFMVCPRIHEQKKYKSEINFMDSGYEINGVQMDFEGETKAGFTTGANYTGKIDLKILTTDTIAKSEIDVDRSEGRDPQVELSYLPNGEHFLPISNDQNIIGGLKFLYDMRYKSGKRRISDFTNYVWVRKNDIDFPIKLLKSVNGERVMLDIGTGACYNIIFNAKIFNNTYLTSEF